MGFSIYLNIFVLVSPKSFESRTKKLIFWITKEKESLKQKETEIKKGWLMICSEFQKVNIIELLSNYAQRPKRT